MNELRLSSTGSIRESVLSYHAIATKNVELDEAAVTEPRSWILSSTIRMKAMPFGRALVAEGMPNMAENADQHFEATNPIGAYACCTTLHDEDRVFCRISADDDRQLRHRRRIYAPHARRWVFNADGGATVNHSDAYGRPKVDDAREGPVRSRPCHGDTRTGAFKPCLRWPSRPARQSPRNSKLEEATWSFKMPQILCTKPHRTGLRSQPSIVESSRIVQNYNNISTEDKHCVPADSYWKFRTLDEIFNSRNETI